MIVDDQNIDLVIVHLHLPASGDPSIELRGPMDLLVSFFSGTESHRFTRSDTQDAECDQALIEEIVDSSLKTLIEIDHYVSAKNHVELVKRRIRDEIVLGKYNVTSQ